MTHQDAASSPIPLLDIGRGNRPLMAEIMEEIHGVCDSGRFLYGPAVAELESAVAEVCGVEHAIGCASGSDALLLSMMAAGIGRGDEVIMPSFTFFATASAVWRLGARPVFADIDPVSFNLAPEEVERAITPRTKAIVPVHLFGQCAEMQPLCDLAQQYGLFLVEDAAQAIGASQHDRPAGSWGDVGCFSFYPTKNLGGFGDGGMLTTNDAALADKLRLLSSHGMRPRYYHDIVGINSRLDTIQAAVLKVKIRHLETISSERRLNAERYTALLSSAGLDGQIELPQQTSGNFHVWNQFSIRVHGGRRDSLREYLSARNIGTEIYYPVPLHLQQCFSDLGVRAGSLPQTERAANQVLALPIFAELTEAEVQTVAHAIRDCCVEQRSSAA